MPGEIAEDANGRIIVLIKATIACRDSNLMKNGFMTFPTRKIDDASFLKRSKQP